MRWNRTLAAPASSCSPPSARRVATRPSASATTVRGLEERRARDASTKLIASTIATASIAEGDGGEHARSASRRRRRPPAPKARREATTTAASRTTDETTEGADDAHRDWASGADRAANAPAERDERGGEPDRQREERGDALARAPEKQTRTTTPPRRRRRPSRSDGRSRAAPTAMTSAIAATSVIIASDCERTPAAISIGLAARSNPTTRPARFGTR